MLKDELEDDKADQFNAMIEEIITHLCDGNSQEAATGFVELANYYAKAGMPQKTFSVMRKYIVGSAINKSGDPGFIKAKLEDAEYLLHQHRKAHRIDNIVRH